MKAKKAREITRKEQNINLKDTLLTIRSNAKNGDYSCVVPSYKLNDVEVERLKNLGYSIKSGVGQYFISWREKDGI